MSPWVRSDVRVLRLADASLRWGIALVRLPERTSALIDAFWEAALTSVAAAPGAIDVAGHEVSVGGIGPGPAT